MLPSFELPYNIWCGGCGKHVGMGKLKSCLSLLRTEASDFAHRENRTKMNFALCTIVSLRFLISFPLHYHFLVFSLLHSLRSHSSLVSRLSSFVCSFSRVLVCVHASMCEVYRSSAWLLGKVLYSKDAPLFMSVSPVAEPLHSVSPCLARCALQRREEESGQLLHNANLALSHEMPLV